MRAGQPGMRRRGITLIELLVVVSIMMLLAVVALPMMRPAMEGRQARETARAINVFLSGVRNRAIGSGRPCGVLIRRMQVVIDDPSAPSGSTTKKTVQQTQHAQSGVAMEQIEIPPAYTGAMLNSTVRLQSWTYRSDGSAYWPSGSVVLRVKVRAIDFSLAQVRRGDLVQFQQQGPWFTIVDDPLDEKGAPLGCGKDYDFLLDGDGFIQFTGQDGIELPADGWIDDRFLTVVLDPRLNRVAPWPQNDPAAPNESSTSPSYKLENLGAWSPEVGFTIFRQPYAGTSGTTMALRSAVQPLQMPRGMVIDLQASGVDDFSEVPWFSAVDHVKDDASNPDTVGIQDPSGVIIIFSPTGSIQSVMCSRTGPVRVSQPIYLLLGKLERMGPTLPEDGLANWQDMANLWVALNPQNGLVSVSQPFAEPAHFDAATGIQRPLSLDESRRLARRAQFNAGGR